MISNIAETTTLSNGVEMPWFGLGVWQSKEGSEVEQAIHFALDGGYRSIDTAAIYENEYGVGKAVHQHDINREEVFITTKVWNSDQGFNQTLAAMEASLKKLQMDYVDLYLVHWPVKGKLVDTWRALEILYDTGKARAIGVCNFLVHHLEELLPQTDVAPMVNQVEFHPYLVQPKLLAFCSKNNIRLEAWSPLMQGNIGEVPELAEIGKNHNKTAAQVVLRWDLQKEVVTIPKSVRQQRIKENAAIFDFELSPQEMKTIDKLDKNHRFGPDPDNFDF